MNSNDECFNNLIPLHEKVSLILLLSFLYGCKVGFTQSATPIFNSTHAPFNVTESDISWMGSISFTGTFVSVILCFFLGDKIGRKWFIVGSATLYLIIWLTFLITSASIIIIVGLGLYGISASMHAIMGFIYIGEVASPQNREIFGICYSLAMLLGIGVEFLISLFDSYRVLIIFPLVMTVFTLLLSLFMKESPYYLLEKNQNDEALAVEAWLNDQTEKETGPEIDKMKQYSQSQSASVGNFSEIFKLENLGILALMVFLNGAVLVNSGNVAQQYGQKVMEDFAHFMNLNIFVTSFNVVAMVGSITALFTVKLLGRRMLLLIGFALMCLFQVMVGISYLLERQDNNQMKELAFGIAAMHCIIYFIDTATCLAGLSILKSEIFSAKVKEFYSALLAFTGDWISFAVVKTYVFLAEQVGAEWVMITYSGVQLIGAILVFFLIQDTKNKSLYDIQNDSKSDKKS